jgi:hypothetical protein
MAMDEDDEAVIQALVKTKSDVPMAALAAPFVRNNPLGKSLPESIYGWEYIDLFQNVLDVPFSNNKPYFASGRPLTLFFTSDEKLESLMKLRIRKFTKFFNENRTLKDEKNTEYSINTENVEDWVRDLSNTSGVDVPSLRERGYTVRSDPVDGGLMDQYGGKLWDVVSSLARPETALAAEWLGKRLRFVDAATFLQKTREIIELFKITLQTQFPRRSNVKVVWFMHSEIARSGTWMSLLLWDEFSPHLDGVVSSALELRALEKREGWEKLLVIVPDDALYTGGQIKNRIDNDCMIFYARGGVVENDRKFFIAAPYWSREAEETVGDENVYWAGFKASEDMQTVGELLNKTPRDEVLMMNPAAEHPRMVFDFGFGLGVVRSHVPTFFAHKLPDYISVPNNLFALAPYLKIDDRRKTVEIKFTTLINGCSPENYWYDDRPQLGEPFNDFVQAPNTVCPYPPYKEFRWTYNGAPVDKSLMPVEVLDALEY